MNWAVLVLSAVLFGVASNSVPPAARILADSAASMGGVAALKSITSVSYSAVGERDMVEQSERPGGPYFIDHFRETQFRDLVHRRVRIERTSEAYAGDQWWLQQPDAAPRITVINDDVAATQTPQGFQYAGASLIAKNDEQFAFAPERLLLTAISAGDAHNIPDMVLHGVRHHVVGFSWRGFPCRLYISAQTLLPWKIDFARPYPYQTFLSAWGDVQTSIIYDGWTLEPGGIVYPREWTFRRVGLPDMRMVITRLRFNQSTNDALLTVPAAIFQAHHTHLRRVDSLPLGYGAARPAYMLAHGIVQYPGTWNVEFVRQNDGVIVIEAPWSPKYTQRAFEAARRMFHARIKAVVTTSDSWPHIAGVRQAVADAVPIYALDLNGPILKRLLAAPHRMDPDDLQKHPRKADIHLISRATHLGDGTNRIVLIPYRTATAERQMMVYLPGQRLLYTSDLFAPDGHGSWFTPEYLHEMLSAVARERLYPRMIFGMHYGATSFQEVIDALNSAVHSS